MLFTNISDWHLFSAGVGNRNTKMPLCLENTLGVVPESPVPEITKGFFGLIKPSVDGQVVVYRTSPQLN